MKIQLNPLVSLKPIDPKIYPFAAFALVLSQHGFVALCASINGRALLDLDGAFWLFPIRYFAQMPEVSSLYSLGGFIFCLAVSWWLAILSYRRALWSSNGHMIALFVIIPTIQIIAIPLLALTPKDKENIEQQNDDTHKTISDMLIGILWGMSIVVGATAISTLSFGSYGWGLFVMTPFLVGVTTAYFCNRYGDVGSHRTNTAIIMAGFLGCLALLMLALEGFVCILMIIPLSLILSLLGGLFGRAIARSRNDQNQPLMTVAILPLVFVMEGYFPPAVLIETEQSIEIAASRKHVWQAVTSKEPISAPPALLTLSGLAYPIESHIIETVSGKQRVGIFSTGASEERVTEWVPEEKLSFNVDKQPPAMEEMSPYRSVHAPHVDGYFKTQNTSFTLKTMPDGTTRLTAKASHMLHIDPVLYWKPFAEWAIEQNVGRVLEDIKSKAER
jgi:hypothetical protein